MTTEIHETTVMSVFPGDGEIVDTSYSNGGEARRPKSAKWRKVLLWLLGAGALGLVGYHGSAGSESSGILPVISALPAEPIAAQAAISPLSIGGDARGQEAPPAVHAAPSAEKPVASASPTVSASAPPPRSDGGQGTGASPSPLSGVTADGKVILNIATESELQQLPGIGRSRAKAIVAHRERVGRFRRLEELLRVKGIGPKRLRALRPRLLLDPE